MYGMVNKAVKEMILLNHGPQKWEEVRSCAGLEIDEFISNEPYPDDVTYQLVGAASEVLGLSAQDVLIDFGRHWILVTAKHGYAELMQAGGNSFPDFLEHLPNFHTRVCMIFPNLNPPDFEVTHRTATSLRLHYHTSREGLTHFVIGLLEGLASFFETHIHIEILMRKDEGHDHDIFKIHWA